MTVGVFILDLRLFGCQSLKQKKSVVARLLNQIRSRYPVSIAEVGDLDLLQRTVLGGSMTASQEAMILSVFDQIEERIYQLGLAEVIAIETEFFNYGEYK